MLQQTLKQIFARDLNKLKTELELYQTETNIWQVADGITNSAGNLCLHLVLSSAFSVLWNNNRTSLYTCDCRIYIAAHSRRLTGRQDL